MRQGLRELLWLLAGGQYLSLLDSRERVNEVTWQYPDLEALRPAFQASSWRGSVAKAVERQWIQKRLISGRTSFQLTQRGKEQVAADFRPLRHALGTKERVVLVVRMTAAGKKNAILVRSLLTESSGFLLAPNVWVFPVQDLPDMVLSKLTALGYQFLKFPGKANTASPSPILAEWILSNSAGFEHSRSLEESITQLSQLLNKISSEKTLHHLQIAQIGSNVVSVLAGMIAFPWPLLEDSQISSLVLQSFELADQVMVEWYRRKDAASRL